MKRRTLITVIWMLSFVSFVSLTLFHGVEIMALSLGSVTAVILNKKY